MSSGNEIDAPGPGTELVRASYTQEPYLLLNMLYL